MAQNTQSKVISRTINLFPIIHIDFTNNLKNKLNILLKINNK